MERGAADATGGTRMIVAQRAQGRRKHAQRRAVNVLMLSLTGVATLVAIVPLVWIVAYVIMEGGRFLSLDFFTKLPTPVGVPGGGVSNAIVGSAVLVGLACLIAIPPGILAALYAAARPNTVVGTGLRFATDVLSGVPSIVVGIFAYTALVVPMKGFSALSGGFALAIIMLPTVIRTTEEMLKLVPHSLREASLALGAPEWKTSVRVLLPAALEGVATGIMLGIARVAGEAAPLVLTAFGNPFMSTDVKQPIAALPQMIYVYAVSPYKDWHDKAWTTALVLLMLVLGLRVVARLIIIRRRRKLGVA
jgi:phosphate transport system permease protein